MGFLRSLLPKLDQCVGVLGSSWESFIEKLIGGLLVLPPFNPRSFNFILGNFGTDVGYHFVAAADSSNDASPSPMEVAADPVDVSSLVYAKGSLVVLVVGVFAAAVVRGAAVILAEEAAAGVAAVT